MLGPLKEALGGEKFSTNDEIKEAVHWWLKGQSEDFLSQGSQALEKQGKSALHAVEAMLKSDKEFSNHICTFCVHKKNTAVTFWLNLLHKGKVAAINFAILSVHSSKLSIKFHECTHKTSVLIYSC